MSLVSFNFYWIYQADLTLNQAWCDQTYLIIRGNPLNLSTKKVKSYYQLNYHSNVQDFGIANSNPNNPNS